MARKMSPEKYPLLLKVIGGRVVHMARQSIHGRAITACGKNTSYRRNDPQELGPATCQACINQPWSQSQRSVNNLDGRSTDQPADLLNAAVNRLRTSPTTPYDPPIADWLANEAAYLLHLDEAGVDGAEDSEHALRVARAVLGQVGA